MLVWGLGFRGRLVTRCDRIEQGLGEELTLDRIAQCAEVDVVGTGQAVGVEGSHRVGAAGHPVPVIEEAIVLHGDPAQDA